MPTGVIILLFFIKGKMNFVILSDSEISLTSLVKDSSAFAL